MFWFSFPDLPSLINRPNGLPCLAKAITDHTSLRWFITNAYINETALLEGMQTGDHRDRYHCCNIPVNRRCRTRQWWTGRQCPILCLARFTEPLPVLGTKGIPKILKRPASVKCIWQHTGGMSYTLRSGLPSFYSPDKRIMHIANF